MGIQGQFLHSRQIPSGMGGCSPKGHRWLEAGLVDIQGGKAASHTPLGAGPPGTAHTPSKSRRVLPG